MELSNKQKEIVNSDASKILVIASAASGKTTTLVARINHLLDQGYTPKQIVAITFTNNAAANMRDRLGSRAEGMYIGTVHGYANYLLCSAGVDTSRVLSDEDFDRLFELIKENPQCIQPVEHLLLDEAQDSTEDQFEFLLEKVNPNHWFLVGDHKQSIYGFNNASPEYLLDLQTDPMVQTYDLLENYRNSPKILDFAKSIIRLNGSRYYDYSIPMRSAPGRVIDVSYSPIGIVTSLKKDGHYGDWFILTRTNDELEVMYNHLTRAGIPCETFKKAQLTNSELNQKMANNTVKVLTIHTAKGLEAKNVIVIGARFYNTEEKCVSYVAATRAKDLLVWVRMPNKKQLQKTINWER